MKADKKYGAELAVFEKLYAALADGKCARTVELDEDEETCLYDTPLLTRKPVIYVANVNEDNASGEPTDNEAYMALKAHAESEHSQIIPICCQIEAEIAELSGEEKAMFLADLGIEESGLDQLIRAGYALLGLISYLTAGPKEVRAWTIERGTRAPQAAGKIHSDFERGFIRAEIVAFDDLAREGSMNAVKEKGLLRSEGKEYVVQDGDVVLFRFNV
jgi:GTP-binding protein YchF